jgi:colanic acid/amylovoran biosynthesis glycosyltransferase
MSAPTPPPRGRVAYVLKMYPRFSETFIVNEILAHETAGEDIAIFSLRRPVDRRVHESVGAVAAPVAYLGPYALTSDNLRRLVAQAGSVLPGAGAMLDELMRADRGDATQAVDLSLRARAMGITHFHAHFATAATTVARLASGLTGIPFTFTAHAKDIFHEDVDPADLRLKLRDATACVTVSAFNRTHLHQKFGADAARVVRVYNGLHLDTFEYHSPDRRPAAIVTVGRLVEKKGFADLIEACGLLADRNRRFTCSIVGSGPLEDDLRDRIFRRGLSGVVTLIGPRSQREVAGIVRHAAAFAAPCVVGRDGNRDGLPTVLLEAMALGTPCVATDVTGIPEILHHDRTGIGVPQHAPRALAAGLERLLDDPALRVRLAREARRLIERDFDVHTQAALVRQTFAGAEAASIRRAA